MRIAYLCRERLPAPSTNTEQLVRTATALAGEGVRVDLLVPSASAGDGETAAFYGLGPTAFAGACGGALRLVRSDAFGAKCVHDVRAARAAAAGAYDLVYVREVFSLAAAVVAGCRAVVFETYRTDINTSPRHALWRRLCYRPRLLGVVAHSELCRRSFLDLGFAAERLLVAYNGVAPEMLAAPRARDDARRALGLPLAARLVVYTGHVGARKGTDVLVDIARHLPEVGFVLVGGAGGDRPGGGGAAPANLRHVARVPPADVAPWLHAADVVIIPPASYPLRQHGRTVLPMKTFLYLACGRPVVAGDLPDVREILRDAENALLVPPDDAAAAAAAIARLLADPGLAERLAERARADAAAYTWPARAKRIVEFLERRLAAVR